MRPAAARLCLALLALSLGTAGCKPSSLTPFWIGERGAEIAAMNLNGTWTGTTAGGGDVRFLVGDNEVSKVLITQKRTACTLRFTIDTERMPIVDNAFSGEVELLPQGRLVVDGLFSSATTCAGSFFFEGLAVAGTCPITGSGQFSAQKR